MPFDGLTLEEILEDLQSRFIINIPREELSSVERVCFQIEQAHWFYEDFVREENPHLPSYSLKQFSKHMFKHCLILHRWQNDHETAFANFMDYKVRVPVCGAIILNDKVDKVLLVKGFRKNAAWGFPKGKINKDEPEGPCAIREVEEEIGFDIGPFLHDDVYSERVIRGQRIRLFIVHGISEGTPFAPQTRKEISDIKWHRLTDLPGWIHDEGDENDISKHTGGQYYMVTSFVAQLKQWVQQHRKITKAEKRKENKQANSTNVNAGNITDGEVVTIPTKSHNHANEKKKKVVSHD